MVGLVGSGRHGRYHQLSNHLKSQISDGTKRPLLLHLPVAVQTPQSNTGSETDRKTNRPDRRLVFVAFDKYLAVSYYVARPRGGSVHCHPR